MTGSSASQIGTVRELPRRRLNSGEFFALIEGNVERFFAQGVDAPEVERLLTTLETDEEFYGSDPSEAHPVRHFLPTPEEWASGCGALRSAIVNGRLPYKVLDILVYAELCYGAGVVEGPGEMMVRVYPLDPLGHLWQAKGLMRDVTEERRASLHATARKLRSPVLEAAIAFVDFALAQSWSGLRRLRALTQKFPGELSFAVLFAGALRLTRHGEHGQRVWDDVCSKLESGYGGAIPALVAQSQPGELSVLDARLAWIRLLAKRDYAGELSEPSTAAGPFRTRAEQEREDPGELERYVRRCMRLYGATYAERRYGEAVPRLRRWVEG